MTDIDSEIFRRAVQILLKKLAVQRVGGRRIIRNLDIDNAISNDICHGLDKVSFGKNTELFVNTKKLLFNEYPVQIFYGATNEILFFYKISPISNLYERVVGLELLADVNLHIEKEQVLILCAIIEQNIRIN